MKDLSFKEKFDKEEVINLRKNYQLSLDDFSKIIGCAKKTLISYEQGVSIPNDNYLITFKILIENPQVILYFINSNKERFTDKELNRINKRISSYVGE